MQSRLTGKSFQINFHIFIPLFFAVYGIYLRVLKLISRDLSVDEIYQFNCIKGPFRPFWHRITTFSFADGYFLSGDFSSFPGEYLLNYPIVRIVGLNKWGLMIPHIFLTVLGYYFLYRVCRLYLKTNAGTGFVFLLVCFNASLILHAFEFRPYGVLATMALGCLYFSEELVSRYPQFSKASKISIGIFFVLVMGYHAYGLLIAGLPIFYSIFLKRDFDLREILQKDYFRYFVIVFLVGAPIWAWYASANAFGLSGMDDRIAQNVFQFIPDPSTNKVGFLKGVWGNLIGFDIFYILFPGLGIPFLVPYKERKQQIFFLLWLIFLPLVLIFLIDLKSSYWFVQRQFVWVMPLFAVYMGWVWESLFCFFLKRKNEVAAVRI